MASIQARYDKKGNLISFQIKVSRGRDIVTRKQLTPYTMTYTPNPEWSDRAIQRDLEKVAAQFEVACMNGEVLTKEEQKQKIIHEQEQARQNELNEQRKPRLNAYIQTYINQKEKRVEDSTVRNVENSLKRMAKVYGEYKIEDITSAMLDDYFTGLLDTTSEKTGELLAIGTIIKEFRYVGTFFKTAANKNIIPVNPMLKIECPKHRKGEARKTRREYTRDEILRLIKEINTLPIEWKALLRFALDSGCRRGEIMGLTWENVNFDKGTVLICQSLSFLSGKGYTLKAPKTHEIRTIDISSDVMKILKEWKTFQAKNNLEKGFPCNGYVFTSLETGEHISHNCMNYYVNHLAKVCGMDGLHPHEFRHMMASMMIGMGVDILTVSQRLGHKNVSITLDVYSHAMRDNQKKAAQMLADTFYKANEA